MLDRDDGCPLEPEDFDRFEDQDGCPDDKLEMTETEIKPPAPVKFGTNKATIRPDSKDVLDQVADVRKAHPELEQVEVACPLEQDLDNKHLST